MLDRNASRETRTTISPSSPPRRPQRTAPIADKRLERVRRNNRWALAALLFPLLFTAVVAVGVLLMFKRQMAFFRPAPSGGETEIAVPIVADRDPAPIKPPDDRTALPRVPDPT